MALLAQRRLHDFDVVYTSDTSVYGFRPEQRTVRLVCFPLERVPEYEQRYRRLVPRVYGLAGKLATAVLRRRFTPHGVWIANSEFTAGVMRETYGLGQDEVVVVYPPVAYEVGPDILASGSCSPSGAFTRINGSSSRSSWRGETPRRGSSLPGQGDPALISTAAGGRQEPFRTPN